jgi:hypothetical protein
VNTIWKRSAEKNLTALIPIEGFCEVPHFSSAASQIVAGVQQGKAILKGQFDRIGINCEDQCR